ncbi:uncharacterized protein NPIL_222571 [Nephila pilipes]|uniref:Secreted protein n=1 Tax=Nephila pilipes TaxID=299642 RepID=A0A8X6TU80_NEPPI|nr:uncharacterized protein NPIL_222571 [Nephila pilipes]
MLVYILILLGAWEGLTEKTDTCDVPSYVLCTPSVDERNRFPSNEDELNKFCPQFIQYQYCLRTYAEQCGEDSVNIHKFSFEFQQKIIDLSKELCEKDSALHSTVVEHIGCLYNVTEYYSGDCYNNTRNKLGKIIEYIEKLEEGNLAANGYEHELWQSVDCLFEAHLMACFLGETHEKCGLATKELILQLLDRIEYFQQYCPSTQHEDIQKLMKVMELDVEEEKSLKEFIYME